MGNVWVNKAQENIHRQVVGIRKLKPDVICLQEVFHIGVLEGYRANFPDYHLMAFGKGFSFNATAILLICYIILSGMVWAWLVWVLLRVSGHFMKEWLLLIPFSTLIVFWWTRKNYLYPFLLGNRTGLVLLVSSVWRTSVSFPRSPSRVGRHRALGKDLPWVKRCTTWRGHRGWPGNYRKFDEGGEATVSALLPGPFHGSHRVGAFPLHRALHSVSGVVRSPHPGGFECSLGTFFLREACVSKFPSLLVAVNDCVAENT